MEAAMANAVSPVMTRTQIDLVECALRVLTRVLPLSWDEIPVELHHCFEEYMEKDVWTGEADLQTFREAAVIILRNAITHTGEFAEPAA
jgi:hypothetical protein